PVGQEIRDCLPTFARDEEEDGRSSIVVVIATDAPLLPGQLKRVTKRIGMGLARGGAFAHNRSGDLFLAFSTVPVQLDDDGLEMWRVLPNERLSPLFEATVQAVEEAVVNALIAAEDLTGQNGHTYYAIPHARLQEVLAKYGRLQVGAAV
ncbi:MAG TPA: P1 family peptidase, partial [bacterium]|nr:P1 family peptidase [bacterium]